MMPDASTAIPRGGGGGGGGKPKEKIAYKKEKENEFKEINAEIFF